MFYSDRAYAYDKRRANRKHKQALNRATKKLELDPESFDSETFDAPVFSAKMIWYCL